jgi:hypothetical protein
MAFFVLFIQRKRAMESEKVRPRPSFLLPCFLLNSNAASASPPPPASSSSIANHQSPINHSHSPLLFLFVFFARKKN